MAPSMSWFSSPNFILATWLFVNPSWFICKSWNSLTIYILVMRKHLLWALYHLTMIYSSSICNGCWVASKSAWSWSRKMTCSKMQWMIKLGACWICIVLSTKLNLVWCSRWWESSNILHIDKTLISFDVFFVHINKFKK